MEILSDVELGEAHARACFADPRTFDDVGPRTSAYAGAALQELERLQRSAPGVLPALIEGGNEGARQLNADALQGLREIVQNADDLGASTVRFASRTGPRSRQLLIAHDGAPVELMHVLPMIYPFLSTKRGHARLKGRFGVGLKTLLRLGSELTIHSPPFHFAARGNLAVAVAPAEAVEGFYDPDQGHTLFSLDLDDEADPDFLSTWFAGWRSDDLIFLDAVRRVSLQDLDTGEASVEVLIEEVGKAAALDLEVAAGWLPAERRLFDVGGQRWARFVVETPVPEGRRRAAKATDASTPIGVAVALNGAGEGRIHVALPTRISTGAAFALDAQFDPATSREELLEDPWNTWLVEASAEVLGALAIRLAHESSALAWSVVPVGAATNSVSPWLNALFSRQWARAVDAFAADDRLLGGAPASGLAAHAYCAAEWDDLIDVADHATLVGKRMVPPAMRDAGGRWRTILDVIGASTRIGLSEILTACEDERLADKPPGWFLLVAGRAIGLGEADALLGARWLPLEAGDRAAPRARLDADELLTLEPPSDPLAIAHDLCRQVHPRLDEERFKTVRTWLTENANLARGAMPRNVLQAFARRYAESPLEIGRGDLVELRDLFGRLDEREPVALGLEVGSSLRIECVSYEKDGEDAAPRVVRGRGAPHSLYLPASIEDEPDGWSRAAGETPGLLWASPTYAELFKIVDRRSAGRLMDRRRGSKRFLVLLGAATRPRLERADAPVTADLPRPQQAARRQTGRSSAFLEGDHASPDLDRVVDDLQRGGGAGRRRGRARANQTLTRGVALFRCLAANWSELEGASTTRAWRTSRYGGPLVEVPATWLAKLIEAQWLVNESGVLSRPRDLTVETKVTRAIYGDADRFAAGLSPTDAASPLARALQMQVDPPASELVRAIERLREASNVSEAGDLLRLYRALAAHCPHGVAALSPEGRVGDMTVASLRAKFGISRRKRGLISGRVTTAGGDDWHAPTTVFSGRDIFHGRQPFVLTDRDLAPLWGVLNIGPPSILDCVRELEAISREPANVSDAVLIDIYRHIDRLVERAPTAERRALAEVPLFCGDRWTRARPIFASDHYGLTASSAQLWSPPCSIASIQNFADATAVELLPIADRPVSPGSEDAWLERRFASALRILKADLARDDEPSYRAMEPWARFNDLQLRLHNFGALILRATPAGHVENVDVRAHAELSRPAVHVDGEEVIGRFEFGGQAIARFAEASRRREVALAWVSAWASSCEEDGVDIELSKEAGEPTNLDELAAQFDRLKRSAGRRKLPAQRSGADPAAALPTAPEPPVRRLKELPPEFCFSLALQEAGEGAQAGLQRRAKTPLKAEAPSRNPKRPPSAPAPASARKSFDDRAVQKQAWVYVQGAFEEGLIPLDDYQSERGIGADGAIDWKTFIEMKSFSREAPAEVTLTESEFRRARERRSKFLLVVVSGLEEGYATELRVYSDPLGTLPWTPKGSVSVGGLTRGRAVILLEASVKELGPSEAPVA